MLPTLLPVGEDPGAATSPAFSGADLAKKQVVFLTPCE